ncbi:MAG TPA: DUF72 domain-containing protein [Chitinophagaceae bacterium]|nr:DUF72 domain-containing protein [Chitinophagaceae bacterium]
MEFGHLPEEELSAIKFSLPRDSEFTKLTLSSAVPRRVPAVYLGCAKWGRKEWVGNLYPKGTKESKFLDNYVLHFNSIELNAMHYRTFPAETVAGWSARASNEFKFCPKVPKAISHYGNLAPGRIQFSTSKFLESIMAFEEHLGGVFLQLSDKFPPDKKGNLYAYLETLPRDVLFFIELRHPGWFADPLLKTELLHALQSLNTGLVITDTAGRRDCVHMELPIPKAFIRFVGNNLHPTDYSRIDTWIKRIKKWLASGLQELYFFMHQPDETYSPKLCQYVARQMNKVCGTKLVLPLGED